MLNYDQWFVEMPSQSLVWQQESPDTLVVG
jgi:hypothetical protein